MVRKYVIFSFIISLFIFLAFPKTSTAEIATVKDWIGLFPSGSNDYTKSGTILNCAGLTDASHLTDGHCWVYTSNTSIAPNCSRTPGTIPQLTRDGVGTNPSPCTFTLSPTLAPTCTTYVFRLMANDGTTDQDVISAKTVNFPVGCAGTAVINGKLFHILGNLTINSDIPVNETGIIFVDGNLYINTNLINNNPKKGIVFVVQGTIYINRKIDTVNAFLISHGRDNKGTINVSDDTDISPFCSAWDDGTSPTAHTVTTPCADYTDAEHLVNSNLRKQLTINGSVISLNANLEPSFVRKYAIPANTDPAEIVNYDPKYLAIMKDVFSRDLKIWREIQ